MAAFDTPWLTHMSTPRSQRSDTLDSSSSLQLPDSSSPQRQRASSYAASSYDGAGFSTAPTANATYATFSPVTLSSTNPGATSAAKRRSTILVHQKSPLLLATPPQITRALAYSHPFLLPLNELAGLLSWTTGEPWESFLLLAAFWFAVLYGDTAVRVAGPVLLVLILIGGMYGRRFSPLSSSGWSEPGVGAGDGSSTSGGSEAKGGKAVGKKAGKAKNLSVDGLPDKNTGKGGSAGGTGTATAHQRSQHSISEVTNTRHQKTLDEMVETLKEFTARCNILLEPLLELTDFLSTQRTPTSATTRPALTTLFVRILLCTPVWFLLTLPPLRIVTTRRVLLVFGTVFLTWHSRVMRVARVILWRSVTVRRLMALVTGLQFEGPSKPSPAPVESATDSTPLVEAANKPVAAAAATAKKKPSPRESELTKALRRARDGTDTGVRFTFIIYENQRRWVGLGWTTSLFAYERAAWTDEHNNPVPPRSQFELPDVEDGSNMRWRWVEGSRWRVDGVPDEAVMPVDPNDKDKEWDYDGPGGRTGWVYYDNKWGNGRRGQDGWGRWTRRRKWYRDAELAEMDDGPDAPIDGANFDATEASASPTPAPSLPPRPAAVETSRAQEPPPLNIENRNGKERVDDNNDSASVLSTSSRSMRAKAPSLRRRVTDSSHKSRQTGGGSVGSGTSEDDVAALGTQLGLAIQDVQKEGGSWGIGDELRMGLE